MVPSGRDLYALEPNHQELDRISGNGHVTRVVDFSKTFPGNTDWRGPSAIARYRDALYVGTLTPFPIRVGAAQVFKVNPKTGHFSVFADGLTTVLGLAFSNTGALDVLENVRRAGQPSARAGTDRQDQGPPPHNNHNRPECAYGYDIRPGWQPLRFGQWLRCSAWRRRGVEDHAVNAARCSCTADLTDIRMVIGE